MFIFLWAAGFYTYFVMRTVYHDKLREIWNGAAVTWINLKLILIRWVFASIGMLIFLYLYDPQKIFGIFLLSSRDYPFFVGVLSDFFSITSRVYFL